MYFTRFRAKKRRGNNEMITLTDKLEKATFVTHAGNFHADDVFGTVLI